MNLAQLGCHRNGIAGRTLVGGCCGRIHGQRGRTQGTLQPTQIRLELAQTVLDISQALGRELGCGGNFGHGIFKFGQAQIIVGLGRRGQGHNCRGLHAKAGLPARIAEFNAGGAVAAINFSRAPHSGFAADLAFAVAEGTQRTAGIAQKAVDLTQALVHVAQKPLDFAAVENLTQLTQHGWVGRGRIAGDLACQLLHALVTGTVLQFGCEAIHAVL